MTDDPLQYLFSLEHFGIKFGLENISAVLAALGNPQRAYASVHVAGTNGKGSVTAMTAAALHAAGYRTGRYTSPHLVELEDRFVVDDVPVSNGALRAAVADVRGVVERLRARGDLQVHPTFFEVTTATAFELFRRAKVDIAVCEVGLGGRLDATNVLTPAVTAITSIARDHEQYLGSAIAEIAFEKAGIVKPGVPVIVGNVPPEAAAVISRVAAERHAPLIWAWAGSSAERSGSDNQRIRIRTPAYDYGTVALALEGEHQVGNALVAIRVLETLRAQGTAVPPDAIVRGLSEVRWRGRLERVRLSDGREALLDAAHNPAGAAALAAYLVRHGEKRPLVFAAMRDKDAAGILRALAPAISAVVITRASVPRSAEPSLLAARVHDAAPELPVTIAASPRDALDAAWRHSRQIVVAGSIFLLGDVIEALQSS